MTDNPDPSPTVVEDAVRRMSFDDADQDASTAHLTPAALRPVRTSVETSKAIMDVRAVGAIADHAGRPPPPPLRRNSVLSTMLEAVSPRSGEEPETPTMFGDGDNHSICAHGELSSTSGAIDSATAGALAKGLGKMGRKTVSLASFSPSSVSPPKVHRFGDVAPAAQPGSSPSRVAHRAAPAEVLSTSAPDERSAAMKIASSSFPDSLAGFMEKCVENPMPQSFPPPKYGEQGIIGEKHVLVMVGLPARGKTHMAKRLCQYLRFFHGANTRVFNVGDYRRKFAGAGQKADFFCSENKETRLKFASAALKDMVDFLFQEDATSFLEQRVVDSGRVAIFDATNSTRERRRWLVEQIGSLPLKLLFIESICTDQAVVEKNVRLAKVSNCDYSGNMTPELAFEDFMQRIKYYEKEYQPMDEEELSFIKLIDCGRRVEINRVHGFLLGRVTQFLANMHATTCSIYLSRHGQSEYNAIGKIGGDSGLSPMGEAYASKLAEFADNVITCDPATGEPRPVRLWTSSLQRTKHTARHIKHDKITVNGNDWIQMAPRVLRNLDEIYAGVCDGMTYEEIRGAYPVEYELRRQNKLGYRYPRGESYLDVIARLDPLVQELESYREDVLIVGHQGVLRLIYAYFAGLDRQEAATLSIPLNTVIKLTPRTHDCIEERVVLYDPAEENAALDPPSY